MQETNEAEPTLGIDWRDLGKRGAIFALLLLVALVILPRTEAPEAVREAQTAQVLARKKAGALDEALAAHWKARGVTFKAGEAPKLSLDYEGPPGARKLILEKWQTNAQLRLVDGPSPDGQALRVEVRAEAGALHIAAAHVAGGQRAELLKVDRLIGRWWSALPPLIAVLMAICFRSLLTALFSAILLGSALQTGFLPHSAMWMAIRTYLIGTTFDTFNLYIIAFTISLVGSVHIVLKMGGLAGLLERFKGLASSRRSTQAATGLMGLAVFFDDYANTIVIGSTMRPLTDHLKISREKLAYLVDSTSAPVAGLAIISTWIGYEVGLFTELSNQLGLGRSGYDIFFDILPLRFYCILTLTFVFIVGLSGRDFGPMLKAERRAFHEGLVSRPGARPLTNVAAERLEPAAETPKRWYNAVIPVGVMLGATLLGMYWSGWSGAGPGPTSIPGMGAVWAGESSVGDVLSGWGAAASGLGSWQTWRDAFSGADNAKVLFAGAVLASVAAFVLAVGQRLLSPREAAVAWGRAVPGMWMAVAILMHAWSIRAVCDDLGTSIYLVGAVQDIIAPQLLPIITFLIAAAIAFATGTSWGTMGLLLPAMIPLAFQLTHGMPGGEMIVLLCFGAVLDGAIFGDHCSPISDTTVMSSIASSCDHVDHVRTQMPYAFVTMFAAGLLGYIGVAYGLPAWLALFSGVGALVAFMFAVGKRVEA